MIPRIIHQMWIGSREPPTAAMQTWRDRNPGWEYRLWNEQNLCRHWPDGLYNQKQFDAMGELCGKCDIARVEILHRFGGLFVDADSLCLRAIDDYMLNNDSFSCYENEWVRGNLVASGFLATTPGNELARLLVEGLHDKTGSALWRGPGSAWRTVGPGYLTETIIRHGYTGINIYPSSFFLPTHSTGVGYSGPAAAYADHWWESTLGKRPDCASGPAAEPALPGCRWPNEVVSVQAIEFELRPRTLDRAILTEVIESDFYGLTEWSPLRPPRFIVDIGAHIGGFTTWAARSFPRATVIGYECDPDNAALARRNTRPFKNARIVEAAVVGNVPAHHMVRLERCNTGKRTVSFETTATGGVTGRPIESVSLSEILAGHGMDRVDFLKIDCEGAEWAVLEAAPDQILQRVDALAMEVHCNGLDGRTPDRMVALLDRHFRSVALDRRAGPAVCKVVATGPRTPRVSAQHHRSFR